MFDFRNMTDNGFFCQSDCTYKEEKVTVPTTDISCLSAGSWLYLWESKYATIDFDIIMYFGHQIHNTGYILHNIHMLTQLQEFPSQSGVILPEVYMLYLWMCGFPLGTLASTVYYNLCNIFSYSKYCPWLFYISFLEI